MSVALLIVMIAVLCLGTFALHQDARLKRINHQLSVVLPSRPDVQTMVRFRLQQDHGDRRNRLGRRLRSLLRYEPNSPRQPLVEVAGVFLGILTMILGSLVFPLWMSGLAGVAVALLTVRGVLGWQRFRYTEKLVRQLPDTVELIVSAVRAGLPVAEAFRAVTREMPEPTREQFTSVVNDMALGQTADEALLTVFERTHVQEYAMFSVTLAVQGKAGGRLAETFQILGDAVRQRVALAGRASALAAEAKLSARVLACLPFVSGTITYIERPDSIGMLFFDPRGRILLAIASISLGLGVLTMRRMIRKENSV